jgi:multicomponent Na+:H+ antiporter subunit D
MAILAAVVGLLTLFSMIKIWSEVFWKPSPAPATGPALSGERLAWMLAPVLVLAGITVCWGFSWNR